MSLVLRVSTYYYQQESVLKRRDYTTKSSSTLKTNHLNPTYSPCFRMQSASAIKRGDWRAELFGKTQINATETEGYIPLPKLIVEKGLAALRQRRNQYNRHNHHKIIFNAINQLGDNKHDDGT